MKRIQCEVCGSVDIQKVSEDVFACQSCGVQYRSEDVKKLLVEIKDILEDIEEKMPDKTQNMGQQPEKDSLWDHCYWVEPKIDPSENVKHFLQYLDKSEEIACDVYKELSIESVKEYYLPFYFIKGQYSVAWSAIACHHFYENETVFEKQFNAKRGEWTSIPVTKQVEKIKRVSRNGEQNCSCSSFELASGNLVKLFSKGDKEMKRELLQAFDNQQDIKRREYTFNKIDPMQIRQEGDRFYFQGWEIDPQMDPQVAVEGKSRLRSHAGVVVKNKAQADLHGGYFENYSYSTSVREENLSFVYVPVQVIIYRYKDQCYTAVSDLVSTTRTFPATYPRDKDLGAVKEEVEQAEAKGRALSALTVIGIVSILIELVALFFFMVIDEQEMELIMLLCATMIVSLILIVAGLIVDAKNRKRMYEKEQSVFSDVLSPRKLALMDSKEAFFASYTDYQSAGSAGAGFACMTVTQYYADLNASMDITQFEDKTEADRQLLEIKKLEEEIQKLQKKRVLPIILMTVFGVLIVPLMIGSILLGNVNAKINQKRAEKQALMSQWQEP